MAGYAGYTPTDAVFLTVPGFAFGEEVLIDGQLTGVILKFAYHNSMKNFDYVLVRRAGWFGRQQEQWFHGGHISKIVGPETVQAPEAKK